jgi:hypothetical protein
MSNRADDQHVLALSCRMLLHDVDVGAIDRDIGLSSAREIAAVIKLWIRQMKIDELKDQRNAMLSNRHKNGHAWQYIINLWYWTADLLVRGEKLLRKKGMEKGASDRKSTVSSLTSPEAVECAEDAKMIIDGLISLGMFYRLSWVSPAGWTLADEERPGQIEVWQGHLDELRKAEESLRNGRKRRGE